MLHGFVHGKLQRPNKIDNNRPARRDAATADVVAAADLAAVAAGGG